MGALLYLPAALLFIVGIDILVMAFIEGSSAALISSVAAFAVALYLVVLAGAHADRPGRVKRSFFRLLGVLLVAAGILAALFGGFGGLVVLPAVCAGILALLVAQGYRPEQAPEPRSIGDAAAAVLAQTGRSFVRELEVARRAARQFRRRPALALAVAVLTSAAFWSSIVSADIGRPPFDARRHEARWRLPFVQRWMSLYERPRYNSLVWQPVAGFAEPLLPPTHVGDGWFMRLTRVLDHGGGRLLVFTLALVAPLAALLLTALLSWIKGAHEMLSVGNERRGWVRNYPPILVVVLIPAVWQAVVWTSLFSHGWLATSWLGSAHQWLVGHAGHAVARAVWYGVAVAPLALLMLAPFAMVAHNLGARAGIAEGLRLLRQRALALAVLFGVYWIGYQVLLLPDAAISLPAALEIWLVRLSMPWAWLWWMWVHWVALALLGLWVAYAFMEIAKSGSAATAETGDGLLGCDRGVLARAPGDAPIL